MDQARNVFPMNLIYHYNIFLTDMRCACIPKRDLEPRFYEIAAQLQVLSKYPLGSWIRLNNCREIRRPSHQGNLYHQSFESNLFYPIMNRFVIYESYSRQCLALVPYNSLDVIHRSTDIISQDMRFFFKGSMRPWILHL